MCGLRNLCGGLLAMPCVISYFFICDISGLVLMMWVFVRLVNRLLKLFLFIFHRTWKNVIMYDPHF